MRLKLKLTKNKSIVPFDYQQKLVGTIHKWFGRNEEHGRQSTFSFSHLQKGELVEKGFIFPQGSILYFSSTDNKLLTKIYKGIKSDKNLFNGLSVYEIDMIATNLSSIFRVTKSCLKGMLKARQGRIISISSVVGATGNAGQANYAAAKAGVVGFSKSLAQEIGSRGVTVNVVAPGFIDTDMTKELSDEQRKNLLTNIPLKSLGQPEDIANAVLFLASDMGSYITGETLHVNGGMYMS